VLLQVRLSLEISLWSVVLVFNPNTCWDHVTVAVALSHWRTEVDELQHRNKSQWTRTTAPYGWFAFLLVIYCSRKTLYHEIS
jgi:hypothetical protein